LAIIHVVGLGPGDSTGLPMGTYRILQSGLPVFLRTRIHPVVLELEAEGLAFASFDDLYESGERFDIIYQQMADTLIREALAHQEIVYAVPGHPLMAEQSVQNLDRNSAGVEIRIGPGQSFLDAVCTSLRVDPVEGFSIIDGTSIDTNFFTPAQHTFVVQVFNNVVASDVKLSLMEVYPDDYEVVFVRAAGVVAEERIQRMPLFDIDRVEWIDHLTTLYVPPLSQEVQIIADASYATDLVRRLRDVNGCPWDRQQTHASLKPYVIEEAYEVIHAIDNGSPYDLADELGDLLLQILLHAQIASESGEFTIRDVYRALVDKLIRRHPHVFGAQQATSEEEANALWAKAKAAEQNGPDDVSVLSKIKWARPGHLVARDLQMRAAEVGFDWADTQGVLDKLREEVDELGHEVSLQTTELIRAEFGDVMFTMVNLARRLDIDIDQIWDICNEKFARRFRSMEEKVISEHGDFKDVAPSQLEKYWNEVKREEKY
jgi:tetrapyrrole methylase family protein/MazG family protein